MPTITQYYPAFVSGFESEVKSFYTKEDLLSIQWVDRFKQDDFHRFSLSKSGSSYVLMAEYEGGAKWFVVGFLNDDEISVMEILKGMPIFSHE